MELINRETRNKEDKNEGGPGAPDDKKNIQDDLTKLYSSKYVYKFTLKTKKGRIEQYGLSSAGTKALVKRENITGRGKYRATDLPPFVEEHRDYWLAKVQCVDEKTGLVIWGVGKQSKKKKDGRTDEHAESIAVSKAQRNGLLGLMPKETVEDFIAKCLAGGGEIKREVPRKEISADRETPPEGTDVKDIYLRTINNLAAKMAVKNRISKSLIISAAIGKNSDKKELEECSLEELKEIGGYLQRESSKTSDPKKETANTGGTIKEFYGDPD